MNPNKVMELHVEAILNNNDDIINHQHKNHNIQNNHNVTMHAVTQSTNHTQNKHLPLNTIEHNHHQNTLIEVSTSNESLIIPHENITNDNNNNNTNTLSNASIHYEDLLSPKESLTSNHNTNQNTIQSVITNNIQHIRKYLMEDFFPKRINNIKNKITSETITDVPVNEPVSQNLNDNQTTTPNPTILQKTKQLIQKRLSMSNKPNERWGSPINIKLKNTTRIYFQNINSIRHTNRASKKWTRSCQYMHEIQCDIFGFAETCVDYKAQFVQSDLKQQCSNVFPNNTIGFSNNNFPLTSSFLPGGTIQVATGHWSGKVINFIQDDKNYGRWSGQSFRLKEEKVLHIITAYRPCKPTCNKRKGSRSTYQQQYILLRQDGVMKPDPRRSFVQDLIVLLKQLASNPNHMIILMLDANESLDDSDKDIIKILNETTLVDTFSQINNEDLNLSTHVKGTKRIDYMFTSSNMISSITQAGYLSFYEDSLDSDHRGLFLDIDNNCLIDNDIDNKRPPRRNIGTKSSPKEIIDYLQSVDQYFTKHNIYQRCQLLYDQSLKLQHSNSEFDKHLFALDSQITEVILKSEQKFCKRIHQSEWSLEVHHCSIEIHYWMVKYKASLNNRNVTSILDSLIQKLPTQRGIELATKSLSADPKTEWKHQLQYKQELLKHSKELRKKGLLALIDIRAQEGKQESVEIIKKISKTEMNKEKWNTLKNVFKTNNKSGINYLEIPHKDKHGNDTTNPDEAISWTTISDPVSINEHLITRNIEHFGQAHGSDFTISPMVEQLDYDGTGSAVEKILTGEFSIPSISSQVTKGTAHLLKKLNDSNKLKGISDSIEFNEWISAIRHWSESTTTSPSGRHLGHIKVCLTKININPSDESILPLLSKYDPNLIEHELSLLQHNIIQVYYQISIACLRLGISLPRWQQVTTAMIKKLPNVSKINKLRVIHLYEADYNLLLKILWARKLVWNAHDHQRLNSGQAGSRPGCNAIDIVILKEMKYLYARLTRSNLATMDNDAKSCYDRIICNLAMLISRYYGMSPNACKLQGQTLRKMKFRLRTAIGDSIQHYSHSNTTPIYGTGQGSCASPAIWLLISSILMDCLSELAGGMTLKDVVNGKTIQEWINGFVDDTSLFCNIDGENINKLRDQLSHDMSIWQELLEASGGKLELSKCFYYILSWKYNEEGDAIPHTITEQLQQTHPIKIWDNTKQTQVEILQKESNVAHKTLGCMKSINGNEEAEVKYIQDRAQHYVKQLKHSQLSRLEARSAYNSIFIPSLRYGLPSFSLSKTEVDSIQSRAVQQFIRLMGYEQGFPRDIAFAHQDFGGLQLPHLYSEMTSTKLEALIAHIRAKSALGEALIININILQLISGSFHPILESNVDLGYIDDNWIMHLRSFIFEINAKVHINQLWQPDLQRENDILLMDIFRSTMHFNSRQLTLVNYWRLYFQVLTLSDLCDPDNEGKIQAVFIDYNIGINTKLNKSLFRWPNQLKPGLKGFKLWLLCLKKCFNLNIRNRRISHKLGSWLPSHTTSNKWQHYYDHQSSTIYQSTDKDYICYSCNKIRNRYSSSFILGKPTGSIINLPFHVIPAIVIDHNHLSICKYISQPQYEQANIPIQNNSNTFNDMTWRQYVKSLNDWEIQLLKYSEIPNTDITRLSIVNSPIISIINDGGVYDASQGTFGTILTNGEMILATSKGKCYNNQYYESAYRSECYGVLSGLIFYFHIMTYMQLPLNKDKTIRLYCDNKKLIRNLLQYQDIRMTVNDHNRPDYDIIAEILEYLHIFKENDIIVKILHVSSYKDKKKNVTHPAIMHRLCHNMAQLAKSLPTVPYIPLPNNNVNVTINGYHVNANVRKIVQKCYHSIAARSFLQQKYNWTDHTIDNIWWKAHALSLKTLTFHDRIRIQKYIHNHCNTNSRENKYYDYKIGTCNNCHHSIETEDHILQCHSHSRRSIRSAWIKEIFELSEQQIPANIRKAMSIGIQQWLEPTQTTIDHQIINNFDTSVQLAYNHQTTIGWDHFVRGRVSISWGNLINQVLPKDQNFDTESWGTKIVSINFKYFLLMWETRCKEEHGSNELEIEARLKTKLLREVVYIQQNTHPENVKDAAIISYNLEEMRLLHSKHIMSWLVSARILHNILKTKENDLPRVFQSNKSDLVELDTG